MSAVVCGKRPHFDELHGSPPISKRHRCGGSPARYPASNSGFSRSSSPGSGPNSPSSAPEILQLRALFPEMDGELVEKVLESCGNNIEAAIKSLSDLRLSCEKPAQPSMVPEQQQQQQQQQQQLQQQQQQQEGLDWVELFVSEMLSATDLDDARARATRALQAFEKALQKDNEQLKGQLEALVNDNRILKRGVTIQHEKMVADSQEKEKLKQTLLQYQEQLIADRQEKDKLKQTLLQYQEQLKALELSNYALSVHLNRAQGSSSMPGHFHPDVF